jgi:zinc D-Ala-D-Ala dipeptidase
MRHLYLIFLLSMLIACKQKNTATTTTKTNPKKDTVAVAKNTIPELEQRMVEQGLVNIQKIDPTIMVELKYSTTDNFTNTDVYGDLTNAYMQVKPAEMLKKAHDILKESYPEYRLLVYDAGRPLKVQHILWNILDSIPPAKRKDFVSDPKEGSIHNFGSAVDLTIYDLNLKKPLDMGTKYDFFGDLAYPEKEAFFLRTGKLTKEQIENRKILRTIMTRAGYMPIDSEWWHFNALARKEAKAIYKIIE